jgi:hypothetical protein
MSWLRLLSGPLALSKLLLLLLLLLSTMALLKGTQNALFALRLFFVTGSLSVSQQS